MPDKDSNATQNAERPAERATPASVRDAVVVFGIANLWLPERMEIAGVRFRPADDETKSWVAHAIEKVPHDVRDYVTRPLVAMGTAPTFVEVPIPAGAGDEPQKAVRPALRNALNLLRTYGKLIFPRASRPHVDLVGRVQVAHSVGLSFEPAPDKFSINFKEGELGCAVVTGLRRDGGQCVSSGSPCPPGSEERCFDEESSGGHGRLGGGHAPIISRACPWRDVVSWKEGWEFGSVSGAVDGPMGA